MEALEQSWGFDPFLKYAWLLRSGCLPAWLSLSQSDLACFKHNEISKSLTYYKVLWKYTLLLWRGLLVDLQLLNNVLMRAQIYFQMPENPHRPELPEIVFKKFRIAVTKFFGFVPCSFIVNCWHLQSDDISFFIVTYSGEYIYTRKAKYRIFNRSRVLIFLTVERTSFMAQSILNHELLKFTGEWKWSKGSDLLCFTVVFSH